MSNFYLNIAEREYLRRSQRYEKAGTFPKPDRLAVRQNVPANTSVVTAPEIQKPRDAPTVLPNIQQHEVVEDAPLGRLLEILGLLGRKIRGEGRLVGTLENRREMTLAAR